VAGSEEVRLSAALVRDSARAGGWDLEVVVVNAGAVPLYLNPPWYGHVVTFARLYDAEGREIRQRYRVKPNPAALQSFFRVEAGESLKGKLQDLDRGYWPKDWARGRYFKVKYAGRCQAGREKRARPLAVESGVVALP